MVVLPDHLHAVWTLPEGDSDFPVRWGQIKARFSKAIPKGEPLDLIRRMRGPGRQRWKVEGERGRHGS